MSRDPGSPTFAVTGGGRPSDAEAVAIAVALRTLADRVAEVADEPSAPAWGRAARREAVGSERIIAPHDLDTGVAPGRVWGPRGTT